LIIKRRLPPRLATRLASLTPCVSFVTIGELRQWIRLRDIGDRRRAELATWLDGISVLPYDREVASRWGDLAAAAARRGRRRPENDTSVAACCLTKGLPLVTGNVKDFADFAEYDDLVLVA
jgi:predicted nucleic acid-binding protein